MDREEQIRRRAHEIWEEEGRPDGRNQDHWVRAENEFGTDAPEAGTASAGPQPDVVPPPIKPTNNPDLVPPPQPPKPATPGDTAPVKKPTRAGGRKTVTR